ncbi:hypothetical protein [Photobacterium indicum]|uniref:hypothetical protein n=1 Tax=Photobacterium indicum TaxID=81447 RepID=UPI003D10A71D
MKNCFLCNSPANINGHDYGRMKIVECNQCKYYEITETAKKKITDKNLPDDLRLKIVAKVKDIYDKGGEPKITFDDDKFKISDKHSN